MRSKPRTFGATSKSSFSSSVDPKHFAYDASHIYIAMERFTCTHHVILQHVLIISV